MKQSARPYSERQPFAEGEFRTSDQRVSPKVTVFASVGSMLPFDRLACAVDEWARDHPCVSVFIQIGDGSYEPRHAEWARILPHEAYLERLSACDLFVAHVGIGSMFQALESGRPMLMLPRLASLGEHTTEHQLHTAARFADTPGLSIAGDTEELQRRMSEMVDNPVRYEARFTAVAPVGMIEKIRNFLNG